MHKSIIAFGLFLVIGAGGAFSQSPPPPAPLIYTAPQKDELKTFVADDESFELTFPGAAKTEIKAIENGELHSHFVYRKGSNAVLNLYEFAFDIENQRQTVFENIKANLLKNTDLKIEAERDIEFAGIKGREFDARVGMQFIKFRVLVSGSRIYEMSKDVTNWHIIGENTKKAFSDEAVRFFDSLKIRGNDDAKQKNAPEGFFGKFENAVYRNEFFGFSMTVPGSWVVPGDEEIERAKTAGLDMLKSEKARVNENFSEAVKNEIIVFAAQPQQIGGDNPVSLSVGITKQPSRLTRAENVAAMSRDFLLTNPKITLFEDLKTIEINGTTFATFTIKTEFSGVFLKQKVVTTMRKGYSITLVTSYRDDRYLPEIERILGSLKFDKK